MPALPIAITITRGTITTMSTETNDGLPRRFLPAFLLLTLDRFGTSYGYELCENVQEQGLAVDLAAVYRAMRSMQQHDLVTSTWARSESGPDRRLYSLTDAGHDAAIAASAELAAIRDGLTAALDRFAVTAES